MSPRCADGGDRAAKLTLIAKLARRPQIVILGSSRARLAEPALLRKLTGRSAFNAAVKGGDAADAWVVVRSLADRFAGGSSSYVWFVDTVIATDGVHPALSSDPRARPYLDASDRKTITHCRPSSTYRPDGSAAGGSNRSGARRARVLKASVSRLVSQIDAHPPHPRNLRPSTYFERTLTYMNDHGVRPVLVLNPIYPRVLTELQKFGFPGRAAAFTYLNALRAQLDFVLVDCQDIHVWGGSPHDFEDATHVGQANMRRMLRYVVRHSDGALRPSRSARGIESARSLHRPPSARLLRVRHDDARQLAGTMFRFMRKRFSGSYFALSAASRL